MKYYFYCPKCGHEEIHASKPERGCVANPRDGYGIPIYHYKCPTCNNLDAGYMQEIDGDTNEKVYYRSVIGLYQNIRGIETNG